MDETVAWLRERPYYDGQLCEYRTTPGREAAFADIDLTGRVASTLERQGIERPYAHQAAAIETIREGDNVVLATQTASGKSLAYTVPALERALDHTGCTLYVAPQVALINDQEETLSELVNGMGPSSARVAQYTGRLGRSEKERVRENQPTVLLTTPDMLHYGILPNARRLWDWFFERLETVVLDEVHEYRGVFGSHVGLVCRRLARTAERMGGDPQFVCCSATIGNPVDHAATVSGQPADSFELVDEDASADGPSHWLLWNPPEYEGDGWGSGRRKSSHRETMRLFVDLVSRGHQTVAFTRSRQTAERYAQQSARALSERGDHDIADSVGAYQAALTDDRRRELEEGLSSGDVRGVWCTNALELGVDIGGLDCVLLDGYPGTRMQAFQQAGRAGRGTDPSLVAVVAGEDQLDQYVMANPEDFFEGDPERAVSNPGNDRLLPDHVRSAATESWLTPADDDHFPNFRNVVSDLEDAGEFGRRDTPDGTRWVYAGGGSPQHGMNLRTAEDRQVKLREERSGEVIAKLPFGDALRDAHPGAVYHHQGRTYEVADLDLTHDVAELRTTHANYFTRVLHDKTITVDADREERQLPSGVTVRFADITMHKRITGYERRDSSSGEPLGQRELSLPETTLETEALYLSLPPALETDLRTEPGDFNGAIHAAEHAAISMFPTEVLCDRRDVGGLSTPYHPHTETSTVFIYDGHPGGVGLTRSGYDDLESLLETTREMVAACPCEEGCPACVQSPHCGNANDPLDKGLALELLDRV